MNGNGITPDGSVMYDREFKNNKRGGKGTYKNFTDETYEENSKMANGTARERTYGLMVACPTKRTARDCVRRRVERWYEAWKRNLFFQTRRNLQRRMERRRSSRQRSNDHCKSRHI